MKDQLIRKEKDITGSKKKEVVTTITKEDPITDVTGTNNKKPKKEIPNLRKGITWSILTVARQGEKSALNYEL